MNLNIEGMDYSSTLGPWFGKTFKMLENQVINLLNESNIGISKQQWLVLNLINTKNGLSQKELAQFVNRDKTSVTRFLNTMIKKGFVEKKISKKDKRISELYITDEGLKIMRKATPIIRKFALSFQEDLTEDEIKNTIKVLGKIQKKILEINKLKSNCNSKQE